MEPLFRLRVAVRWPVALGVNRMDAVQVWEEQSIGLFSEKSAALGPVNAGVSELMNSNAVPT